MIASTTPTIQARVLHETRTFIYPEHRMTVLNTIKNDRPFYCGMYVTVVGAAGVGANRIPKVQSEVKLIQIFF